MFNEMEILTVKNVECKIKTFNRIVPKTKL